MDPLPASVVCALRGEDEPDPLDLPLRTLTERRSAMSLPARRTRTRMRQPLARVAQATRTRNAPSSPTRTPSSGGWAILGPALRADGLSAGSLPTRGPDPRPGASVVKDHVCGAASALPAVSVTPVVTDAVYTVPAASAGDSVRVAVWLPAS